MSSHHACHFNRYRYKWQSFSVAPAGNTFQRKIDEIFKDLQNTFRIADDMLVVDHINDGRDHDKMLQGVLLICRKENLKLNKANITSGVHQSHFGKMIFEHYRTWSKKTKCFDWDAPEEQKRIESIPWNNDLNKFFPSTAEVCDSLR